MPKLACVMRVKNEELKIRRCLASMPFVDKFIVADNGSTDNTLSIVQEYPSTILHTKGLDAARDMNLAYREVLRQGATHLTWLDADEVFEARAAEEFPKLMAQDVAYWHFRSYPFVLSTTHYRVDGLWRQFTQKGQRWLIQAQPGVYWASGRKAHQGLPRGIVGRVADSDIRVKHWVVESEEEAERKIAFYEEHDGKSYGHLRHGLAAVYEEWKEAQDAYYRVSGHL